MTVSAMVFGDPPGYWPLTTTVGGTISGYSLMGNTGMASSPAAVIKIASTVANIGRSMKNEEMFMARRLGSGVRGCGTHGNSLRRHRDPGVHSLCAVYDDHIAGLEPFPYDPQAIDHASELDLAIFNLIIGTEQQYVLLILVGVDGTIIDQDRRMLLTAEQLHARE